MPSLPSKEIKAEEIAELLRTKYAIFTGGHDREFRSLIIFPDFQTEHLPDESFTLLMQYLSNMNSMHASVHSFVVLIDRRTRDWNSIKTIINKLNTNFPATLDHIYVIKPQGFLQKFFVEKTMAWIREESKYLISFVDKLEDLFPFIDSAHLPTDMGGELLFTLDNWLLDRIQFEQFRDRVTAVCFREHELLEQLSQSPVSPCTNESKLQVYELNPSYAPSLMTTWKKRRRKLLNIIAQCEADGLKLRQALRGDVNGSASSQSHRGGGGDDSSAGLVVQTGGTLTEASSSWTHADPTFDLPVDRVFHVINLEHTLVRLTEARAQFNLAWRQFTKRAGVAKLMADIEQRFKELEPLSSLWENLLESASDYYQPTCRTTVRQPSMNLAMRRPVPAPPLPRRPSLDEYNTTSSSIPTNPVTDSTPTNDVRLEDLQAIVNRLTEADQLGTRLVPDLSALSKTASWLISYVKQTTGAHSESEISGIDALTRFTFHLDSDNSEAEDSCSPTDTQSLMDYSPLGADQHFPALKLPANANEWPVLFDKLRILAETKLPTTVDQLSRLAQLYSEMDKASSWVQRGSQLVNLVICKDNHFSSWPLEQCHTRLNELMAFYTSHEEDNLKALTDPKMFHSRFAGIVNAELRNALMELLKQVEDVEQQCQTTMAALRQHISRTSFPRHQSSSQSMSSPTAATVHGDTSISDSNPSSPTRASTNLHDTRGLDAAPAAGTPRSSPVRITTETRPVTSNGENGFVRSKFSDTVANPVNRFRLAWIELVETERSYVNFLQCVYDIVWLPDIDSAESGSADSAFGSMGSNTPAPPFMRENQGWLLVNWPELLCFHRDYLLPSLECANTAGVKLNQWACQVAPRMVDLYSVYCSLHDSAVQVAVQLERDRIYANWINTCNEKVHCREQCITSNGSNASGSTMPDALDPMRPVLRFSSRLVTPVQRFQRYHLLIERLVRLALTDADRSDLTEAHRTMLHVCETVNLTMRFRGLSIRPSDLGRLLLRGDFAVSRDDSRMMSSQQRHVFLFTNAMLLTKFRTSSTANTPCLTSGSFSSMLPLGGDFSAVEGKDRAGSNSSLQSSSSLPLVSNLANLAKSHILTGGSSNAPVGGAMGSNESGPVYEIRQELLLAQIGLTPSVRADRRRFAIWTANRAQTYVFHANDSVTRDRWVHSINDLLMAQLRRLRDEALQRHAPNPMVSPTRDRKTRGSSQADRSCSLPMPSALHYPKDPTVNASVLSLPAASGQNTRKKIP